MPLAAQVLDAAIFISDLLLSLHYTHMSLPSRTWAAQQGDHYLSALCPTIHRNLSVEMWISLLDREAWSFQTKQPQMFLEWLLFSKFSWAKACDSEDLKAIQKRLTELAVVTCTYRYIWEAEARGLSQISSRLELLGKFQYSLNQRIRSCFNEPVNPPTNQKTISEHSRRV